MSFLYFKIVIPNSIETAAQQLFEPSDGDSRALSNVKHLSTSIRSRAEYVVIAPAINVSNALVVDAGLCRPFRIYTQCGGGRAAAQQTQPLSLPSCSPPSGDWLWRSTAVYVR
ncbi:hypothetical protein ACJJTC_012741 [Scirpophaga incertulas]